MDAMRSPQEEIALQGIEFWSNVSDEEYELQILQQEVRIWHESFRWLIVFFNGLLGSRTESSTRTDESVLCARGAAVSRACFTSTIDHARRKRRRGRLESMQSCWCLSDALGQLCWERHCSTRLSVRQRKHQTRQMATSRSSGDGLRFDVRRTGRVQYQIHCRTSHPIFNWTLTRSSRRCPRYHCLDHWSNLRIRFSSSHVRRTTASCRQYTGPRPDRCTTCGDKHLLGKWMVLDDERKHWLVHSSSHSPVWPERPTSMRKVPMTRMIHRTHICYRPSSMKLSISWFRPLTGKSKSIRERSFFLNAPSSSDRMAISRIYEMQRTKRWWKWFDTVQRYKWLSCSYFFIVARLGLLSDSAKDHADSLGSTESGDLCRKPHGQSQRSSSD